MPKRKTSDVAALLGAVKDELVKDAPAEKQAPASAAKTPAKAPPGTAWERYWARLDANIDEDAEGPLKGLGRMMIRGVRHMERSRDLGFDRDEGDEEQKPEASYTDAEMDYMRFIIVTQRRADEQEHMNEVVLGEDAHQSLHIINTSFSYRVLDSLADLQRELKQCKGDAAAKLDKLLGYTCTIDEFDVWMDDHEMGWGGHRFLAALARLWKPLLQQSDAALGIDGEFTRKGVVCLLEKFKSKVEAIDQYGDTAIKFNFQ